MTPGDWKIESNEPRSPIKSENQKDAITTLLADVSTSFNQSQTFQNISEKHATVFRKSFKISTYLFGFIAGPYEVLENKEKTTVPMRIFMRASLFKDIKKDVLEEMFKVTQVGMNFYKDFFGLPF